jgi:hypothetical protein
MECEPGANSFFSARFEVELHGNAKLGCNYLFRSTERAFELGAIRREEKGKFVLHLPASDCTNDSTNNEGLTEGVTDDNSLQNNELRLKAISAAEPLHL